MRRCFSLRLQRPHPIWLLLLLLLRCAGMRVPWAGGRCVAAALQSALVLQLGS